MNKVILVGRLAKDCEVRQTQGGASVLSGTIAVSKTFKNAEGKYDTNYINFIAWGKTAERIAQYCKKGHRIGIIGTWETRSYDAQDGTKRYVNECFVENVEFLQDKPQDSYQQAYQSSTPNPFESNPFENVQNKFEIDDSDLPF